MLHFPAGLSVPCGIGGGPLGWIKFGFLSEHGKYNLPIALE